MRTIDRQRMNTELMLGGASIPSLNLGFSQLAIGTGNPLFLLGNAGIVGGNAVGGIVGSVLNKPTKKDIDEWNNNSLPVLIPGVAGYRAAQRSLYDQQKRKRIKENLLSENVGLVLPTLVGAGTGATIGGLHPDVKNKTAGIAVGGLIGGLLFSVPTLVGMAIAKIKKRSKKQQQKYDDRLNNENYFVPGVAGYNTVQRLNNI